MSLMYKLFKIETTAEDCIDNVLSTTPEEIDIAIEKNTTQTNMYGYNIYLETEHRKKFLGTFRSTDFLGQHNLTIEDEIRAITYTTMLLEILQEKGTRPTINKNPAEEYFKQFIKKNKEILCLYNDLLKNIS